VITLIILIQNPRPNSTSLLYRKQSTWSKSITTVQTRPVWRIIFNHGQSPNRNNPLATPFHAYITVPHISDLFIIYSPTPKVRAFTPALTTKALILSVLWSYYDTKPKICGRFRDGGVNISCGKFAVMQYQHALRLNRGCATRTSRNHVVCHPLSPNDHVLEDKASGGSTECDDSTTRGGVLHKIPEVSHAH